ncbi:unnamed protein product, partial [Polarella glacialis]
AMPANSWLGRKIQIEPGLLTVIECDGTQDQFNCALDEVARSIDIVVVAGGEELHTARGVFQLEADGEVLIACRNERPGGARPSGPPEGLPSVEELRAKFEEEAGMYDQGGEYTEYIASL